jgi:hypothetical protein
LLSRVLSGFGLGIGGSFVLGAVEALSEVSGPAAWDRLKVRPFPQTIPKDVDKTAFFTDYRRAMTRGAGVGVFMAGVKHDPVSGGSIDSPGVLEEFELLVSQGGCPIPVGSTGGMTRKLWERVRSDPTKFFGPVDVAADLERLGASDSTPDVLLASVDEILKKMRKPRVPF